MAENTPQLAYLLDPAFQIENKNGKPLVGGWIEVFLAGTDTKYITYQNFDWTQNPFKIPLGSDGRAVILAETDQAYDVYCYDSFGNLAFSRLNVSPATGAGGTGLQAVIHDNTLTGNGTQLKPLGVSPLTDLAVDDTMTAYEATVEGKEALVLGVNGDWFNSAFNDVLSGKVDTSAFEECCSAVKGGLSNKVDLSYLTNNYYNKTDSYNLFLPRSEYTNSGNYYTTGETFNRTEIVTLIDNAFSGLDVSSLSGKKDIQAELHISDLGNVVTAIHQNENGEISADFIAITGGGESVPWISGTKEILPDTIQLGLGSVVQSLSSFDLSGYKNHHIMMKGGIYRLPDEYSIANSLISISAFAPFSSISSIENAISGITGDTSYLSGSINYLSGQIDNKLDKSESANYYPMTGNPSGFITNISAESTYQPIGQYASASDITGFATTSQLDTASSFLSGAIDYVSANAGGVGELSAKLDTSAFDAWSSNLPDTYLMVGGTDISISSDDVAKTTTISFTGSNGDAEVNQVVHNYSANGTWLTNSDLAGYSTTSELNAASGVLSGAVDYISSVAITSTAGLATTSQVDTASSFLSGAIDYVSANAGGGGKTYTGIAPITVDNVNDEISITGMNMSAGPGIDMFQSGGYIVISSNSFPMEKVNGVTAYTANADASALKLTRVEDSVTGRTVNIYANGVYYNAYPGYSASAAWDTILTKANESYKRGINVSAYSYIYTETNKVFYESDLNNLDKLILTTPYAGPNSEYSAEFQWDDGFGVPRTAHVLMQSGCTYEFVKSHRYDTGMNGELWWMSCGTYRPNVPMT